MNAVLTTEECKGLIEYTKTAEPVTAGERYSLAVWALGKSHLR